jgi:L-alanine-DL-glutamate epimerase-like enolase superfamily enzyme
MIEHIRPIISNAKLRMGWPWMVEAALWDLSGKYCNMPVYKMWGGYSNKMRIYASAGEILPLEKRIEYVQTCIDLGITAAKLRMHSPNPEDDLEDIRTITSKFAGKISFMVDANQADHLPGASDINHSWDTYTALHVARELEKLNILWLEEPLARYNYEGLATIARKVDIPLAGGEKNTGLNEFKDLAQNEGYHILQGDSVFCEGMFQMRKAAALAEANHKLFIPHTWSNPIGLMANMQVAASLPNCPWFELPYEPPAYTIEMYNDVFKEGIKVENGFIHVPEKPGLGFEFLDGFIEENRVTFSKESCGIR